MFSSDEDAQETLTHCLNEQCDDHRPGAVSHTHTSLPYVLFGSARSSNRFSMDHQPPEETELTPATFQPPVNYGLFRRNWQTGLKSQISGCSTDHISKLSQSICRCGCTAVAHRSKRFIFRNFPTNFSMRVSHFRIDSYSVMGYRFEIKESNMMQGEKRWKYTAESVYASNSWEGCRNKTFFFGCDALKGTVCLQILKLHFRFRCGPLNCLNDTRNFG